MDATPAGEKAVRIERISPAKILKGRQWINEENMYSTGPALFEMFGFPPVSGSYLRLGEPNTAVPSQKSAMKNFNVPLPVDSSFEITLRDTIILLEVVVIMQDPPENLTFRPEIVVSPELGCRICVRS